MHHPDDCIIGILDIDELVVPNRRVHIYWNADDVFYNPKIVQATYREMPRTAMVLPKLTNRASEDRKEWKDVRN